MCSSSGVLSQNCFDSFESLEIQMNFRMYFLFLQNKNAIGILIGISLNQ